MQEPRAAAEAIAETVVEATVAEAVGGVGAEAAEEVDVAVEEATDLAMFVDPSGSTSRGLKQKNNGPRCFHRGRSIG
jgi:hypothetical protein